MYHPGIGSRTFSTTNSLCSPYLLKRELVVSGSSCHMLLWATVLAMASLLKYTLCILFCRALSLLWLSNPLIRFLYWGVSVLWKYFWSLCLDNIHQPLLVCFLAAMLDAETLVGLPPPKKVKHRYPHFQTSTRWDWGLHHLLTTSGCWDTDAFLTICIIYTTII